jgi:hypothetical protein
MKIQGPSSRVVFHQKPFKKGLTYWYIILVILLLFDIAELVLLARDLILLLIMLPLLVSVTSASLSQFYSMYVREKMLIADHAGIEYHGPKYRIASSWEDLLLARHRPLILMILPKRLQPTLLISRKPVVARYLWIDRYLDPIWRKNSYFIPLGAGIWQEYEELLRVIRAHRPDLNLNVPSP